MSNTRVGNGSSSASRSIAQHHIPQSSTVHIERKHFDSYSNELNYCTCTKDCWQIAKCDSANIEIFIDLQLHSTQEINFVDSASSLSTIVLHFYRPASRFLLTRRIRVVTDAFVAGGQVANHSSVRKSDRVHLFTVLRVHAYNRPSRLHWARRKRQGRRGGGMWMVGVMNQYGSEGPDLDQTWDHDDFDMWDKHWFSRDEHVMPNLVEPDDRADRFNLSKR